MTGAGEPARLGGQVLVLTAASGVPDAVAARAAEAARGGWHRLGPGAVEVTGAVAAGAAAVAALPVDANIVAETGRRKRLLLADMDSTIISVECIDEIADYAGVKAEVAAITERAMRGELDFEGALIARVALLRGLPVAALEEVWRDRVRLNPGARSLVQTMAAAGAVTALVSGGFTFFTERVAAAAGFAVHRANTLLFEDGRLTGAVSLPILGREAKRAALAALAAEAGLSPADAVAVGDGANDLAMIEAAGLGIAYRARPALREKAGARIDHGDLSAILALQGFRAEEHRG